MYMSMCLSRLPVTSIVVRQQVVIDNARNLLVHKNERVHCVVRVHKNERVLSVVWQLDDIIQLCVVVILSLILQALVEVIVLLKALIS